MPVRHVEHMIEHETTARVMLNRKMHHADFLFSPATQDKILAEFAEVGVASAGACLCVKRRAVVLK